MASFYLQKRSPPRLVAGPLKKKYFFLRLPLIFIYFIIFSYLLFQTFFFHTKILRYWISETEDNDQTAKPNPAQQNQSTVAEQPNQTKQVKPNQTEQAKPNQKEQSAEPAPPPPKPRKISYLILDNWVKLNIQISNHIIILIYLHSSCHLGLSTGWTVFYRKSALHLLKVIKKFFLNHNSF